MNNALRSNPRLPRCTAVMIFGLFGALCGVVVDALLLNSGGALILALMAGASAVLMSLCLYNKARFDRKGLALGYGGLIGLISHLPFTLSFAGLFSVFPQGALPRFEEFFGLVVLVFFPGIILAGPFLFVLGALAGLVIYRLQKSTG